MPTNDLRFERGDIAFEGVDQSGPSFEVRVFLNNPDANLETPLTPEAGYAGSFHVYGYGTWPEDIGKTTEDGAEPEAIRAPIEKFVIATEAIRKSASSGREVTVTVVPVFGDPPQDAGRAFKFKDVRIVLR
ncbi:MAG: hypothetical protein ACRD8O_05475 [Bryobacteraceae bacterium]